MKDSPQGTMVTSATGGQVYHQPDEAPVPTPEPPPPPVPAPLMTVPTVDAAADAWRAIVAAAKFTRKVDKKDPHVETIEFRRRSLQPIGVAGETMTATGDEAMMQLTGFCIAFLEAIGYLPSDVDEGMTDDESVEELPEIAPPPKAQQQ